MAAILVLALTLAMHGGIAAAGGATPEARPGAEVDPTRTIKERLGNKASDEQRVDNCKVPPDRRGTKPRPDDCRHDTRAAPNP